MATQRDHISGDDGIYVIYLVVTWVVLYAIIANLMFQA